MGGRNSEPTWITDTIFRWASNAVRIKYYNIITNCRTNNNNNDNHEIWIMGSDVWRKVNEWLGHAVLTCKRLHFRKNIHRHHGMMALSRSRLRWSRGSMNNSTICESENNGGIKKKWQSESDNKLRAPIEVLTRMKWEETFGAAAANFWCVTQPFCNGQYILRIFSLNKLFYAFSRQWLWWWCWMCVCVCCVCSSLIKTLSVNWAYRAIFRVEFFCWKLPSTTWFSVDVICLKTQSTESTFQLQIDIPCLDCILDI